MGGRIGDISYSIQRHIERRGLKVHLDFTGHGIGLNLHQLPCIPNYGPSGRGSIIEEGMCLAIEPMINAGTKDIYTESDGWTVKTKDGKASAHFEHTIIITKNGAKILSASN